MFKLTKAEKSWAMYDWANSVYSTIITAAVFPIYFATVVKNSGSATNGDVYWAYATSIGTLIVALLAPFLGAIGDYKGFKKKLFTAFMLLGASTTLLMAVKDNWKLMLVGYILSYIGFAGAGLFYDSFLTDVTTKDRMDKVSAFGFAAGYIGGSTIPFLISIGLIMFADKIGISGDTAVRISVAMTSVWWALFSIPFLMGVKQVHYIPRATGSTVAAAFRNIGHTFKSIVGNKKILYFLLAYFCYIDGVGTVIHMSTIYGSTLGLDSTKMILALLLTQIIAIPCSILFAHASKKFGSLNVVLFGVCVYVCVCIVGFIMGQNVENAAPENLEHAKQVSTTLFWVLACLVGTSQGGIQALSRSYFGKIIPPERSNEYFGFFDIIGRFSAVVGPALYGLGADISGRSSIGIISIIVLFIVGGIFLIRIKKTEKL